MPILATYTRGDARGTAHLLAAMALGCLNDPEAARDQEVALNNVYRLLEAFRTGSLGRVERANRLPRESALRSPVYAATRSTSR
jgi:hypothetical protein